MTFSAVTEEMHLAQMEARSYDRRRGSQIGGQRGPGGTDGGVSEEAGRERERCEPLHPSVHVGGRPLLGDLGKHEQCSVGLIS